jgi:hypothetical protein
VEQKGTGGFVSGGVGGFSDAVTGSPRSVAACYGGAASGDFVGRMLFRMAPGDGTPFPIIGLRTFTASSKDHLQADSGTTTANLTQVRLQ